VYRAPPPLHCPAMGVVIRLTCQPRWEASDRTLLSKRSTYVPECHDLVGGCTLVDMGRSRERERESERERGASSLIVPAC